jgi:hypothetical protein
VKRVKTLSKKPIVLITLLLSMLFLVTSCGLIGHTVRNTKETANGIIDKTVNADNVIYNYEWFKMQYNSYLGLKEQVKIAQKSVDDYKSLMGTDSSKWTSTDKSELSRLNSIVQSLQMQLQNVVAEYNAKSQMVNRSIFKTGDLPEQVE